MLLKRWQKLWELKPRLSIRLGRNYPWIAVKQYDIIIFGNDHHRRTRQKVKFSDPYYYPARLLLSVKINRIEKPEDLSGKKAGFRLARQAILLPVKLQVEVIRYDSIDLAVMALQNKNIDAVVSDAPTMASYVQEKEGIKLTGEIFTAEEYGMAMRLEDTELHEAVNAALAKLKES
jgi:polar amino acid transport system substrate-binding protein